MVHRSRGRNSYSGDTWVCLLFYFGCALDPWGYPRCMFESSNVEMVTTDFPETSQEDAGRHGRLWDTLWERKRAGSDLESSCVGKEAAWFFSKCCIRKGRRGRRG